MLERFDGRAIACSWRVSLLTPIAPARGIFYKEFTGDHQKALANQVSSM
jgi:hypothetical protein